MRMRTLLLMLLAVLLAGGTALLGRAWLQAQRSRDVQEAVGVPLPTPTPGKSVLVASDDIKRGQILGAQDLIWQVWPEGRLDKNYLVLGGPKTPGSFAGWVVRNPISGGEPITEGKIIAPGDRGFLAAVLRPGTRAISVPVTVTSGISGFVFPGDEVDLLVAFQVPPEPIAAEAGRPPREQKAVRTVLHKIRVIAIDQQTQSKSGEFVVARTATFEVTPKQSEIIALASEIGKLVLTLRSLVPTPEEIAAAGNATAETAADSPVAATATYTLDSEIISLLRTADYKKNNRESTVVTILRGSAKGAESR